MQDVDQLKRQTIDLTRNAAHTGYREAPNARPVHGRRTAPGVAAWRGALFALAVGLLLGALTNLGQSRLPSFAGSLANSGGPWVLVAFLVAWRGSSVRQSIGQGSACLVALDVGYYITAASRGIPVSAAAVAFWVLAAVVVGPIVGLAAGWVRHGGPVRTGAGAGILTGFLAGESIYALHYLSQSTSPAYWTLQLLVAGALGVWLTWRGSRWLPSVFVSALACAIIACVVYTIEVSA
jgi:hypothetical protein